MKQTIEDKEAKIKNIQEGIEESKWGMPDINLLLKDKEKVEAEIHAIVRLTSQLEREQLQKGDSLTYLSHEID